MKKIGILFGRESSFPQAFIDRVNSKKVEGVCAEAVVIDQVLQGEPTEYAVIIDRISQDVPFYRAYLKNAAIGGAAVINNPFWWSADEKFFNNALATRVGVPVPKTVLLPSKARPDDTNELSFRNLKFPLSWDGIFGHIGFPAFMKPHAGGGWKSVYKVDNIEEVFDAYNKTGQLVMMIQEAIEFDAYFRCYCIGSKYVRIMHYEPRNPHHLRYHANHQISAKLLATIEQYVLDLNIALGYDFNTVEFAIRDGIPYAIDFCNPAPDADEQSVGKENFEWVVETAANYAIERALQQESGKLNLTWGTFVKDATKETVTIIEKEIVVQKEIVIEKVIETVTVYAEPLKEEAKANNLTPEEAKQLLMEKIGSTNADQKDDLKIINGIGPKIEQHLNSIGIYTFEQVSKITETEYELIDKLLPGFKSRVQREQWAEKAQGELAKKAQQSNIAF